MEIHFQTKSGNKASHRGNKFIFGFPYSEDSVVEEKAKTALGSRGEGGDGDRKDWAWQGSPVI